MRLWTARLVLRLTGRPPCTSVYVRDALVTVLAAADAGEPAALRSVARVLASQRREAVWRVWLAESARRWSSPVVTELAADEASVPVRVVNAAWSDWLAEHDATLWSLLQRWNRPATGSPGRAPLSRLALGDDAPLDTRTLTDTALRFDHPIGERARARLLTLDDGETVDLFCTAVVESGTPEAASFCAAHHLAPYDPVQRAVFFVRTGQHDQYRALDPDGELLALGYRGAPSKARSALRQAMTGLGGIDVLRVLAGQRSREEEAVSLGQGERAYLVRQFRARGEWDRLWRLTVLLPLAEAVEGVREFGDWRPPGEDERRMFETLLAADVEAVSRPLKALAAGQLPHVRSTLSDLDEWTTGITDLDFAPDGRQLAFATHDERAGIVDLDSAGLSRLHRRLGFSAQSVAHLGADTLVVTGFRESVTGRRFEDTIYCCEGFGRRKLPVPDDSDARVHGLARVAGDRAFVVLSDHVRDGERTWTLSAGQAAGSPADTNLLDGLPLSYATTVVEPGGRLVAVLDRHRTVVIDLADSVTHELLPSWPQAATAMHHAALSPSALLRADSEGHVDVWREPLTSTEPPVSCHLWPAREKTLTNLAWSPSQRRFLGLSLRRKNNGECQQYLEVLDVPESPDRPIPDSLVSSSVRLGTQRHKDRTHMRLSPQGDVLAVSPGVPPVVDFYPVAATALPSFIGNPMGLMSSQNMASVAALLDHPLLDEDHRTPLHLLHTCLEHRFQHDIGIGPADVVLPAGDHDIELGG
ncbi:hypothetical protein [Streptomyces sp. NPDC050704]|uniref:hypothetical protein n=1 Tax=Streptomyces sp. NPDC050704 TaxID=3157219 RepID=UPI003437CC2D